jgi:fatty-acyl-CoA synthase
MIISDAENIYPVEVEQAIATLQQVSEAGVIGASDEEWGERVVACEPGCALNEAQVRTPRRAQISSYKLPREVLFVDSLPRNGTNKVDRGELRRLYVRHAAGGSDAP